MKLFFLLFLITGNVLAAESIFQCQSFDFIRGATQDGSRIEVAIAEDGSSAKVVYITGPSKNLEIQLSKDEDSDRMARYTYGLIAGTSSLHNNFSILSEEVGTLVITAIADGKIKSVKGFACYKKI